jgi:xeroderma pigmentosum group C-complementing protein
MLQTITNDSTSSEESDFEWEEVVLGQNEDRGGQELEGEPVLNDLTITIGGNTDDTPTRKRVRRRAITSVERKLRLDIHKMHVLCLLYHVHRRNSWCNDAKVQSALRRLPSPQTLQNLVPNPEFSQFQASNRFIDGIKELRLLWTNRFSLTALGMHKPRWTDIDAAVQPFSAFDELDDPMDRQAFRKAASALQGSQDVGAQLFCALLRAIGVETRLVCSLQPLPFASAAQPQSPQAAKTADKSTIVLDPYNSAESATASSSRSTPTPRSSSRPKKRLSRLERAIGERSAAFGTGVAPKPKKKYHAPFPVYWVEVLNPAVQKWITVDALSTFTVDRPEKLEPPLNHPSNSLVYAVAFEEDLTAKDVTRRYAKAYNAKTRKFRVESTEGGAKWWRRALNFFRRNDVLDRDQVEDAALARKEAAEGMPKNIQDFKGHPIYVLERHLRHNEVIHPKKPMGKVNLGTAFNPKMEPIYRRGDVHIVRSADKWYRLGRDVKDGEQPLKHAKPRKGRSLSPDPLDAESSEQVGAGLYAFFQTELYVPPPVVGGRVPRNMYGNFDVYVPSMVPPGGVHIRHQHANKAARILGVDYADAVTGFQFKGRHGTAVIQGIIVAEEYGEAVNAVLEAMEYAQEQAADRLRSNEALRLWRRFYLGLRILQRVNAIEIDGQRGDVQRELEEADKGVVEQQLAGGFFPEGAAAEPSASGAVARRSHHAEFGGGFVPDEADGRGGFIPEELGAGAFIPEESGGGGFFPTDSGAGRFVPEGSGGGGFIPDDDGPGGFIPSHTPSTFGSSLLGNQKLITREENSGGGFIPDDVAIDDAPSRSSVRFAMPSLDGHVSDFGGHHGGAATAGGFITGDDDTTADDEAATDALFEDDAAESGSVPVQDAEADHTFEAPAVEDDSRPEAQEPTNSPQAKSPMPSDNEDTVSETGSLPLEDPEDEDADPEWLVDVT